VELINPLVAFIIALAVFAGLLYKRIGLGISLSVAALLLGLLTIGPTQTLKTLLETLEDYNALTVTFASFAIMLLSQIYKETGLIDVLTESIGGLIRNSKVILGLIPAIIGLMPVAGGALMSAPMVDEEAKKLKLDRVKRAYINFWFRHTIFPIYPISSLLILTAMLTQTPMFSIIYRQIPVVIGMIIIGYFIGLWKVKPVRNGGDESSRSMSEGSYLIRFLFSFSPILFIMLLVAAFGVNVAISAFAGVLFFILISKPKVNILAKVFRNWSVYEITLAAFGAFFFRNAIKSSGLSEIISGTLIHGNFDETIILIFLPLVLAFLMGSPSGGIAVSVPILSEILDFTAKSTSLLYMSAFLGYLGAPTHLCLAFTVEYFKSSLSKLYKYLVPSLILSMILTFLVYLLVPA